MAGKIITGMVFWLVAAIAAIAGTYEANWDSLDRRPIPSWWTDAKFGIFVHWGPYSVPAYAPTDAKSFDACYSEWYQGRLLATNTQFIAHHCKNHGNAPYGNFAAEFKAENFHADEWADLFRDAGAKYVVLTAKHHDGYALWPSPESPYYNAKVLGSGRDLAGEFTTAMKKAGLRSGFYFSILEHANPLYPGNFLEDSSVQPLSMEEWSRCINLPQMKELVENYQADVIWTDGEWDHTDKEELSEEFLAWLYNESSVRDSVVVNDRWGKGCRGKHGGHYTTEYSLDGGDKSGLSKIHPWEECRGIGRSFGYNQFENAADYMSREKCIETLVSVVAGGGNLLLNVGPTSDGRIPPIMQDRLLAIGKWLKVNGEAIYGTERWNGGDEAFRTRRIYFTRKGRSIYAIIFGEQERTIRIPGLSAVKSVRMLGFDNAVIWKNDGDELVFEMPTFEFGRMPSPYALGVEIGL